MKSNEYIVYIIVIITIFLAGCSTISQTPPSSNETQSGTATNLIVMYNFDYLPANFSFFCINESKKLVEIPSVIEKGDLLLYENIDNITQKTYLQMKNEPLSLYSTLLEEKHSLVAGTCRFQPIELNVTRTQILSGSFVRQENYLCKYLPARWDFQRFNLIQEIYKSCFKLEEAIK